jgi:sulfate/thiosulfate transport system ATP-binding protein
MQVTARSISKNFGSMAALNDVSVNIASGELMALLGPSGSGKTTLLRVIAGLEIPASGQILFGENDTSNWPVQKRQVGFVFQHYALFRHMTVFDNIAFGQQVKARGERLSGSAIADKVNSLLKLVQLEELGTPSQLSGGQRQRVALARALAIDPQVLLLDEPFGALDAKVRKDLRRWLRELHDETGLTTLFVTHDQEEALELADRVAVLNQGRIEQVGSPNDIFDTPATAFVHDFIGETSKLLVQIDGAQICLGQHRIGAASANSSNGTAILFVRPQHVSLSAAPSDNTLPGRIASIRRSGARYRIEADIDGTAERIELETADVAGLSIGTAVHVALNKWQLFPT